MGRSVRQQARARALEKQEERRRERVAADRRKSTLGVEVSVALGERDEAVRRYERKAGEALLRLTRDESVNLAELDEWVPDLSASEARRLKALADVPASRAQERGTSESGPAAMTPGR